MRAIVGLENFGAGGVGGAFSRDKKKSVAINETAYRKPTHRGECAHAIFELLDSIAKLVATASTY